VHGLPPQRGEQLHRGQRGGHGVLGLPARQQAGVTHSYEGHQGPVTGVSTNAVQGGIDFSHWFLTSSFDWTVKLWNMKVGLRTLAMEGLMRTTRRIGYVETGIPSLWHHLAAATGTDCHTAWRGSAVRAPAAR